MYLLKVTLSTKCLKKERKNIKMVPLIWWCLTLTVAGEQEDKCFILYQIDDGLFVGVIFRRRVR